MVSLGVILRSPWSPIYQVVVLSAIQLVTRWKSNSPVILAQPKPSSSSDDRVPYQDAQMLSFDEFLRRNKKV